MRNEFSQDGNRRGVYVRTRYSGREGKRGLSGTRAICETQWKRVLERGRRGRRGGGGRPPAISTAGFARPFRILKGKFPFIRAGFSPTELFGGARLADSSSDGK